MTLRHCLFIAALCAGSSPLAAQSIRPDGPSALAPDYERGALGIAPVWNGLAIVRGTGRTPVANLNFFWPRQVAAAFDGDSAVSYASRAIRTRRTAAALTDMGGVLLAAVAVRATRTGRLEGGARGVAMAGASLVAASVPLHFSADGWLARAVWWHNASFAR